MRTWLVLALAVCCCLPVVGCKGVHLNPSEAEVAIQGLATQSVDLGLKMLSKDVETWEKVKKHSQTAKDAIDNVAIPSITGMGLDFVTVAAVDQILVELDGKVDPTIQAIVQLAINGAAHLIKWPENPTDRLSSDQKWMIVSVLRGISDGITSFQKWGGPASRTLAMPKPLRWK
jgi:hypothetical protein